MWVLPWKNADSDYIIKNEMVSMTKPLSSNENEKVLYTSAHPSYFCPMWTYHTRTWSVYVVLTRLDNCDCCSHLNLWPSEARRQCGKTKGVNFHLGTVYTIHVWWNWQWCLVTNPNFKIVSDSENTQDSAGTVLAASAPGHAQRPHRTSLDHSECQIW